jgi:hypothetical protein
MKYLRIIFVYITLLLVASCAGHQVTPSNDSVKKETPVRLVLKNVYKEPFTVLVFNWTNKNSCTIGADVRAGELLEFENFARYGDVYDIKWYKKDGTFIHWYSFKITSGRIHILSQAYHTVIIPHGIDADFEWSNNDDQIGKATPWQ